MPGPLEELRKLSVEQEYYPGSKHPIIRHLGPAPEPRKIRGDDEWDQDAFTKRRYPVKGVEREFFTLGALAKALGRSQQTIRGWEKDGVIPSPNFKKRGTDSRGTRRLYTREQVEGLRKIAEEEGLMTNDFRAIKKTQFTPRAFALFEELRSQG